jgi:hypothetical protein
MSTHGNYCLESKWRGSRQLSGEQYDHKYFLQSLQSDDFQLTPFFALGGD